MEAEVNNGICERDVCRVKRNKRRANTARKRILKEDTPLVLLPIFKTGRRKLILFLAFRTIMSAPAVLLDFDQLSATALAFVFVPAVNIEIFAVATGRAADLDINRVRRSAFVLNGRFQNLFN